MKTRYKYIHFVRYTPPGFEWVCRANRGERDLCLIGWNLRWREYEMVPYTGSAYTVECLADIRDFLAALNAERSERRDPQPEPGHSGRDAEP